jgi:hypothetical protein
MSLQESLFQELDAVQVIGLQIRVNFFFFLSMVLTISCCIRSLSPFSGQERGAGFFYFLFTAALDILAGS